MRLFKEWPATKFVDLRVDSEEGSKDEEDSGNIDAKEAESVKGAGVFADLYGDDCSHEPQPS